MHKDPFDRLLIATAQEEKLTLISADKHIQQYDVDWLW
ncbi:MAG: PIN domain-containing protein [Flavobacteriales bacterium]|nr:PIN domain-containing protein [Flavobacteriales bacterium]